MNDIGELINHAGVSFFKLVKWEKQTHVWLNHFNCVCFSRILENFDCWKWLMEGKVDLALENHSV